jgi:hypothetical protein
MKYMMKTCQTSIKPNTQIRGKKGTRWMDSSQSKKKGTANEGRPQGKHEQIK